MRYILTLFLLLISQISLGQGTKVGVLFDQFASTRWRIDSALLVSEFDKLGIKALVEVAHSDFDLQMIQGSAFVDEKVSAIIIVSVDGTREHTFFQKAKENSIPVIAYDRPIFDKRLDLYISYNNKLIGKTQAQYLLDNIKGNNIIMVNGPVTDINAIKFREGQLEVLKPYIDSGKINIVQDIVLDSWNEATALLAFYEYSLDLTNVHGLLFALDTFVKAVIEYSSDSDVLKDIYITGQDPAPHVVERLESGVQNMSILKPLQPLAQKTAELTLSLINEEEHLDITTINFNETNSVQGYLFQPIVVEKNNVDDYVDVLLK